MTTGPEMVALSAASKADVKIRAPRHAWMWFLVVGGFCLVLAVGYVWLGAPWFATGYLVAGCLWVAGGLWVRSLGVDLTPESADLRGVRRRSVPWPEVQAGLRYRPSGAWYVQLILESGEPVMLPAPSRMWGLGGAEYERDFHCIGQFWLAHRGESWRPLRPEAPRLPFPE